MGKGALQRQIQNLVGWSTLACAYDCHKYPNHPLGTTRKSLMGARFTLPTRRQPIKWILVDCPVQLPTNMLWTKNIKQTSHPPGWFPQSWWLRFGLLSPGSYHLGNEEWDRRKCPGLQIYMEGTCRAVPGVQHSEGARSQAQWNIQGCYWNWFQ